MRINRMLLICVGLLYLSMALSGASSHRCANAKTPHGAHPANAPNHAHIAETRTSPVSVQLPVAKPTLVTTPSADAGTFVWVLVGLFGFIGIVGKVRAGQRQRTAAKIDAGIKLSNNRVSGLRSNDSVAPIAASTVPTMWIPPGRSIVVADVIVPGGMLYVGSTLVGLDGEAEPAQIDPALSIAPRTPDPAERLFAHWPRYSAISPLARRAYLTWLAGGRCDPSANIGYVFLFFYGLERRVLVDAASDTAVKEEITVIADEIERLRSIYDDNSFLRYSSDLLDFLASGATVERTYLKAPPPATSNRGMTLRLRVGLGQCAVDGRAVSPDWALAWARSEANVHLPGSMVRCAAKFDAQFKRLYQERFGEGLLLTVNRTKLKISYRPASVGLVGHAFTSNLGELPDVTTVVTPLHKLQAIVNESADALGPYSRFIGRHADRALSLEATLLLPQALWPRTVRDALETLDNRIGSGMLVIKLAELLAVFGGSSTVTRGTLNNLFMAVEGQNVGIEPDVLSGARAPKPDDSVVMFRLATDDGSSPSGDRAGYEAVAVMLDLAITLANADGRISGREVQFLNRQVDAWSHVGPTAQKRLRARLRLGIVYPPTLSSLRNRIEPLPASAREALAKLLSAVALADGNLRPAAVKHLEKVYQLLGLRSAALYSELHVASAAADTRVLIDPNRPGQTSSARTTNPVRPASAERETGASGGGAAVTPLASRQETGFKLDPVRIAALQRDSERVTAMLSKVFEEQGPAASVAVQPLMDSAESDFDEKTPRLLGLDPEHSAFLRVLLTRQSWTRVELADIAADMELMLDGALERVNEAALDTYDARIADGEDPIEIAQDLIENVSV